MPGYPHTVSSPFAGLRASAHSYFTQAHQASFQAKRFVGTDELFWMEKVFTSISYAFLFLNGKKEDVLLEGTVHGEKLASVAAFKVSGFLRQLCTLLT